MPKVKGLSRSNCRRSSSSLLHLRDDLKSHHAIIPEHHEQEEQYHEVQVHYCISSSSSSLLDQQQDQQKRQQQSSYPAFEKNRRVSFENTFSSPPPSPSTQNDVTSRFLNSEYAFQTHPQHQNNKPQHSHLFNAHKTSIAMAPHRASLSKLSRSGCLSSLVDQAVSEPTAVNSISEENLSNFMDNDCERDTYTNDQTRSLSHDSLDFHTMEDYDVNIEANVGGASSSTICSGWGQYVDVIPLEPSSRRCRVGKGNYSHATRRYSPYGIVSQRKRRSLSCVSDDGYQPRIDWSSTATECPSLRHSASTDGISSALYKVQI